MLHIKIAVRTRTRYQLRVYNEYMQQAAVYVAAVIH